MIQNVNGFACRNPADAALARRGINPAGPAQPASAPAPAAATRGAATSTSLSAGPQASSRGAAPLLSTPTGGRGQFVDLLA